MEFYCLLKIIIKNANLLYDETGESHYIETITPITPQEWWSLAPWNYDMDSAPKDYARILILRKNGNCVIGRYDSGYFRLNDVIIPQPTAWLPLPDNKLRKTICGKLINIEWLECVQNE